MIETKKQRILVVDDEEFIRITISEMLNKSGYNNTTCFENGEEALQELVKDPHYDLLITDNNMPGMQGYELIEQYKASPNVNGTKFMVMSGYLDNKLTDQYRSLGAAVMDKPFKMNKFIATVDSILRANN